MANSTMEYCDIDLNDNMLQDLPLMECITEKEHIEDNDSVSNNVHLNNDNTLQEDTILKNASKLHKIYHKGEFLKCEHPDCKSILRRNLVTQLKINFRNKLSKIQMQTQTIKVSQPKFVCELCNFQCTMKCDLELHIKMEHTFKCEYCGSTTSLIKQMNLHLRLCLKKKKSTLLYQLQRKLKSGTNILIEDKKLVCSICKFDSLQYSDMVRHMGKAHNALSIVKLFQCKLCAYKSSSTASLKEHAKMHMDQSSSTDKVVQKLIPKFVHCQLCGYKALQLKFLKKHVKTHIQEVSGKLYSCTLCAYTCDTWRLLNEHVKRHTGLKTFQCAYCAYRSGYRQNLLDHMVIHTNKRISSTDIQDPLAQK